MEIVPSVELIMIDNNGDIINDNGVEKTKILEYKVPSMAIEDQFVTLQDELAKILNEYSTNLKEYQKLQNDIDNSIITEDLVNKEKIEEIRKITKEIRDINFQYDILMFKIIIKTNNLTTEEKELFASDYKSPFWRNQNKVAIGAAVASFRRNLGI